MDDRSTSTGGSLGVLGDAFHNVDVCNVDLFIFFFSDPIRINVQVRKSFMHGFGQEGQGLIEYSLIIVLIAIVVMAVLLMLGPGIGNLFSNIISGI